VSWVSSNRLKASCLRIRRAAERCRHNASARYRAPSCRAGTPAQFAEFLAVAAIMAAMSIILLDFAGWPWRDGGLRACPSVQFMMVWHRTAGTDPRDNRALAGRLVAAVDDPTVAPAARRGRVSIAVPPIAGQREQQAQRMHAEGRSNLFLILLDCRRSPSGGGGCGSAARL